MNLPEEKIATLLNDTYNAHVSVGTVVDYLKKAAELFGDEYKHIKKEMRESRICNYDDTGQRVDGRNRWLWAFANLLNIRWGFLMKSRKNTIATQIKQIYHNLLSKYAFVSKEAVLYLTSKNRGKKVVIKVLGEDYDGVSGQDFYPSFDGAPGRKQKCWSHLIVPARKNIERKHPPPESLDFYEGLLQIFEEAKEAVKGLEAEEERTSVSTT